MAGQRSGSRTTPPCSSPKWSPTPPATFASPGTSGSNSRTRSYAEVTDEDFDTSNLPVPDDQETSGRGLRILHDHSDQKGVTPAAYGNTVWFEIHLPAADASRVPRLRLLTVSVAAEPASPLASPASAVKVLTGFVAAGCVLLEALPGSSRGRRLPGS